MANELNITFNGAATIYAILRRLSDGKVWNGTAFVSWVDDNIGTYDLPLTSQGGDLFSADMPATLPHSSGNYRAMYYKQAGGSPAITDIRLEPALDFRWNGNASAAIPPGTAAGEYADESDLRLLLGSLNLDIESNREDDTATADSTAIQAALDFADQYINLALRTAEITVPVDTDAATATEVAALKDIDVHLAAWWLHTSRGLFDMKGRQSGDDIAGRMAGFKEYSDEQIDKLKILLTAADDVAESTSGAISAVVGSPKQYPGTGCVRPVSVTLPAAPSPLDW